MSTIETPTDWMNLPDWDRYWSEVLADGFWTASNVETWSFEFTSLPYLRGLQQREGHRVLLAGNGISPEPYGFAHAGCDVTVVEVSGVACRFVQSLEVTPDLLGLQFTAYDDVMDLASGHPVQTSNREKSLKLVDEEHRPGGCLSIITSDLFTYEPSQPFDAIFSRRAYQGFPLERREELARRFFRWLRPGGLAFIETMNVFRERERFESPFRAAGFRVVEGWSFRAVEGWPQRERGERCAWFSHCTG
jgi:hypothetical protein